MIRSAYWEHAVRYMDAQDALRSAEYHFKDIAESKRSVVFTDLATNTQIYSVAWVQSGCAI